MSNEYFYRPAKEELETRIGRLYEALNRRGDEWDCLFLVDKINQYYLTGTMQDAVFILKKDGAHALFVRKSHERARLESQLDCIYPMSGYRDIFAKFGGPFKSAYLETEVMPYAMFERINKYAGMEKVLPADPVMQRLRAVKSENELACMRESGRQHRILLDSIVPGLLKEGMSESDLTASLYDSMIRLGYHGVTRFAMFQTEITMGQYGFGENSLYPTGFDGPGGMKGMHPAAYMIGDRSRFLKKGDLVFMDIGYGVDGYHSDGTQVYMFGAKPSEEVSAAHRECMRVQKQVAGMLRPGQAPDEIYRTVMDGLDPGFADGFMGYKDRAVRFLGHGVGLQIDEFPVIAKGFTEPLEANMAISVEPKKGIAGVGTVGVEDTYIVTATGGECITGGGKDIMAV